MVVAVPVIFLERAVATSLFQLASGLRSGFLRLRFRPRELTRGCFSIILKDWSRSRRVPVSAARERDAEAVSPDFSGGRGLDKPLRRE